MTITRLVSTGFELGTLGAEGTVFGSAAQIALSNTAPKTGTYALRCASGSAFGSLGWAIPATYQIKMGVHIRTPQTHLGTTQTRILRGENAAGDGLFRMETTNGNDYNVYVGTTLVGTIAVSKDTYYHWGFWVKIDATAGRLFVYKDGVLAASYTGNTGSTQITKVTLGTYPGLVADGWASGEFAYYDDLTIDDATGETTPDRIEISRFVYLPANGNGNYSDWDGSDLDKTNNYQLVDDLPHDSNSTYVYTGTTGIQDSYALANFSAPSNCVIRALIPVAVAKKQDSTDCKLVLGTRLSSTDLEGTAQDLPTSYELAKVERQIAKPGSGVWTEADVNSAEVYMKSDGTFA